MTSFLEHIVFHRCKGALRLCRTPACAGAHGQGEVGYINVFMRKDMRQSIDESVKRGLDEAAKLLAAAIVGRSRTNAGVSAKRDAETRPGRHATYHDLLAPSNQDWCFPSETTFTSAAI